MILLPFMAGRSAAVLGLGRTGLTAALALLQSGAKVAAWDDNEDRRADAVGYGVPVLDLAQVDFRDVDYLVLSPGIPMSHPTAERARNLNIKIVTDISLFAQGSGDADIITITGTNGKSTTTALIGHILSAMRPVAVGGNIGYPVLELPALQHNGTYVLELSSYQLDFDPPVVPRAAVLLNITPDHLDRHGDMDGYIAAKMKIFNHPPTDRRPVAVIGIDTPESRKVYDALKSRPDWVAVPISVKTKLSDGIYVDQGKLYEGRGEAEPVAVMDLGPVAALRGVHNHENAAAAYAAVRHVYGADPAMIASQIQSFAGLPHRQHLVRVINGVAYVNDSKATNAEAAGKALACFRNIYWILGGKPKDGGLHGLEPFMDRIRHAFLIGQAADSFAEWLTKLRVPFTKCGTIDVAVHAAHDMVQDHRGAPGGAGTVLLSPACASFDQFHSFEHRGDVFSALVHDLPEIVERDIA